MPSNPLTISANDSGRLSMEFTTETFSDFVFSLLATPRQERQVYAGGFDLTLDKLRNVVDKIAHKAKTDHDILHSDFVSEIIFFGRYQSYDKLI